MPGIGDHLSDKPTPVRRPGQKSAGRRIATIAAAALALVLVALVGVWIKDFREQQEANEARDNTIRAAVRAVGLLPAGYPQVNAANTAANITVHRPKKTDDPDPIVELRKVDGVWYVGCLDAKKQFVAFTDHGYGQELREYWNGWWRCPVFMRGDKLPPPPPPDDD
jgi:hypothetical protein